MIPWTKLRTRSHGLLWFGLAETAWSITDPNSEQLEAAYRRLRPGLNGVFTTGDTRTDEEKQRDNDLFTVLRAVDDYRHLTTYELGVGHIIKKLRVIWRAIRESE